MKENLNVLDSDTNIITRIAIITTTTIIIIITATATTTTIMTSTSLDRTVHKVTSFIRFNIHQVDPMYVYLVCRKVR